MEQNPDSLSRSISRPIASLLIKTKSSKMVCMSGWTYLMPNEDMIRFPSPSRLAAVWKSLKLFFTGEVKFFAEAGLQTFESCDRRLVMATSAM